MVYYHVYHPSLSRRDPLIDHPLTRHPSVYPLLSPAFILVTSPSSREVTSIHGHSPLALTDLHAHQPPNLPDSHLSAHIALPRKQFKYHPIFHEIDLYDTTIRFPITLVHLFSSSEEKPTIKHCNTVFAEISDWLSHADSGLQLGAEKE